MVDSQDQKPFVPTLSVQQEKKEPKHRKVTCHRSREN